MSGPSGDAPLRDPRPLLDDLAAAAADSAVYASSHPEGLKASVPALRRRRRPGQPDPVGVLTLTRSSDGVLRWHEGPLARTLPGRRRRAAAAPRSHSDRARVGTPEFTSGVPEAEPLEQFYFEKLEPNEVAAFLARRDQGFTPNPGLRRLSGGQLVPVSGPMGKGRLLLIVHGTFSNSDNLLEGVRRSPTGPAFLQRLEAHYDQVLTFDHPTVSVSPILNALDLAAAFAATRADVDVIAHSRGGLVARWWLDALGGAAPGRRRAVLVGSPLGGTSLAAPPRLRQAMNLLTNFGAALKLAGAAASVYLPFLSAPVAILRVATSITGFMARTPVFDAAVAMIPGLAGQSRVLDNPELDRARRLAAPAAVEYSVVQSNFETEDPGWRFWRRFRGEAIGEAAADVLFPGENDLVVDTASMTEFSAEAFPSSRVRAFRRSSKVHHTSYFEQPETLHFIADRLAIP